MAASLSSVLASGCVGLVARPAPARLHGWAVTVGDSYISGDGARWAGNTDLLVHRVDALGPDAYVGRGLDATRCQRAKQSIADLGAVGLRGKVLGCAGATTSSSRDGSHFTPGLDNYSGSVGTGQTRRLGRFATSHHVSAVVVSIGGNDFGFGSVLATCISSFMSTAATRQPCSSRPDVTGHFGPAEVADVAGRIAASIRRVAAAMQQAHYSPRDYRLVVLTYPDPLPPPAMLRYPQTLQARLWRGGCPLFNADLAWAQRAHAAVNRAVWSGVRRSGVGSAEVLDMSDAFTGHRLCERGVGRLEDTRLASWRAAGAAGQLEWVNRLHLGLDPAAAADSLHPNYWGMLAERACVALALRRHNANGQRCLPAVRAADLHRPGMTLR